MFITHGTNKFAVVICILFMHGCAGDQYTTFKPRGFTFKPTDENSESTNSLAKAEKAKSPKINLLFDFSNPQYQTQQIKNVSIEKDLPGEFEVEPSKYFFGNIQFEINEKRLSRARSTDVAEEKVHALLPEIVALKNSGSQSLTKPETISADSNSFSFALTPNESYQIVYNPNGKEEMPPSFMNVTIEKDENRTFKLNYSGSALTGQLKLAGLSARNLSEIYHIGVFQKDQLVSSKVWLDSAGSFKAVLSSPLFFPSKERTTLKLSILPNKGFSHFPRIEKVLKLPSKDLQNKSVEVLSLSLSLLGEPLQKKVLVLSEEQEPVPNALIVLEGEINGFPVKQEYKTNDLGETLVKSFLTKYKVRVETPLTSEFGEYKNTAWEVNDNNTEIFTLKKDKLPIEARVLDFDKSAVEGVLIQLSKLESNLRVEARSNQEGKWCAQIQNQNIADCQALFLFPGQFKVKLVPPLGSELAAQTEVFEFDGSNPLEFYFKKPVSIEGRLIDKVTKEPVPNAFVKVFDGNISDTTPNFFFLSQTITDENGQFKTFVTLE